MPAVKLTVVLAAAIAATLVALAATASAATVKLGWTERLKRDAATALTFKVASLTINAKSWTAIVEITNKGNSPVLISQSQFGIAEFDTPNNYSKPTRVLRSATFIPAVPAKLKPGKAWKGTIGGVGVPNDRLFVRLVFGPFATKSSPTPFTWITDHAQHRFQIAV